MGLKENASAKLNAAYVDAQRTINSTCAHKDFIDFVIIIPILHINMCYLQLYLQKQQMKVLILYVYKKNPNCQVHMMQEQFAIK